MLEAVGTVMIAAAVVVLLMLMGLARQPGVAKRIERPAVAETITLGLAALLALGLGLAEFGSGRSEVEASWVIEAGRFGMIGGAFVLMWLWFRLGHPGGRASP
jgi:hypothetical protein